ncbi:glycosyltransferase [Cronobacter universalis]|uniref:glycosyltransferase family 2 protein n=1 Tax=Cronobacter universalis TaxID=535744 RepID=UPI002A1A9283|nr:glycosyltransferase [Cronobacter universalis]
MPFLSIIIAAHNCGETLAKTLDSLISALSGAHDYEVIIINDASDDNTQDIINNYSETWSHYQSVEVAFNNVGKVRNKAISIAKGQYITMLDSDDLLKPGCLDRYIEFLKNQRPDMLITRLIEIRDLKKMSPEWDGLHPQALSREEAIRRFLIHKDFQAHLIGQFISKDLYNQAPIPAMTCYEDFAIFPKLLMCSSKLFFQSQGHYYYVKRQGSLSSTPDDEKTTNLVNCTREMERLFPDKFRWLVYCHWLDIYLKFRHRLNASQYAEVYRRVVKTRSAGFLFSPDIRFSYKKKAIKSLWIK